MLLPHSFKEKSNVLEFKLKKSDDLNFIPKHTIKYVLLLVGFLNARFQKLSTVREPTENAVIMYVFDP